MERKIKWRNRAWCFSKPGVNQLLMPAALMLYLFLLPVIMYAQNIVINGRVTDDNNQPVAGASVIIKGAKTGTTTNQNGEFTISAPGNATLVISAVDHELREVKLNNQATITVSLKHLDKVLGEVVVTGYGTQRKRDVTGSVVSLKGETLREVPAPNLIAQLKGQTAGVTIVSNSATPGGSGQIRIRGNRTLTTSQFSSDLLDGPLLVLDGVPFGGSINDINPDDIASIEILKDASATAIYGSRGSGGVILITTKRGRTGRITTTYEGYVGITNIMGKLKVFNGQEFAQFKLDAAAYNRTNWPASAGTSSYLLTPAEQAALAAGISTNWQDLIYEQGFVTNHNIGILGGNESTQYGLSGGYFREEGIIPNQDFERYAVRATIDHQINKRLKFGANIYNILSYSNTPGGAGVAAGLVRLTPLAAPYNPDGTVNLKPAVGSVDDPFVVSPLTLITKASSILARNRRLATYNTVYGEVNILPGLRYRFNGGFNYQQIHGDGYSGPGTYINSNTAQSASAASINDFEGWTWNIQHLLYYTKTFFQKHKIDFTGLYEAQKDHSKSSSFNAVGIPADYILNSNFALANTVTAGSGNFSERGIISWMGRLVYSYDNRYLLTATVRRDGASPLSPGHQYFTYPAFALGWNATNEDFMQNINWLNNLKIRGGWGKTSNQGINPYATLGLLATGPQYTYNFGNNPADGQQGYLVTSLANTSLKWQSTSQWNAGLDFGILKNRITGSVDVYKHKTKDILLTVNLPPSNGASSTVQNLGKTEGRGIEINLSSINIQNKNGISWTTDLNFYFNREKIVQLTTPNEKFNIGNGWFVGEPLTVIYDVKKIGIWQLEDSIKGILQQQTTPVQYPGQIRIEDVNGDKKIDANDRQILGNFQPRWEGGITNRVAYKNFDLSILIYARMGMKVVVPYITADGGAQGFPFFMQSRNNQLKVNYWTRTNPTNEFPAPDAGTDRFLFASTLGYRDGSFVKCRSINLGYQVPPSLLQRAHISSLRIYVNVTNLFILYSPFVKDDLGPDPEGNGYGGQVSSAQSGGSVGAGGASGQGRVITVNANNPSTRQFIVGVNLKF
jgi:TonB-linked SusC/RagA family outer membrane protein